MSLGNEAFLQEVISDHSTNLMVEPRWEGQDTCVTTDGVAGTRRVVSGKTGGVWIHTVVTESCFLGLTSVSTFSKLNTCLRWLHRG